MTPTDCLMTQEEAEAMAHAIPRSKLVVVPGTSTGELCGYFAELTGQAASWSGRSVTCDDAGITVQ